MSKNIKPLNLDQSDFSSRPKFCPDNIWQDNVHTKSTSLWLDWSLVFCLTQSASLTSHTQDTALPVFPVFSLEKDQSSILKNIFSLSWSSSEELKAACLELIPFILITTLRRYAMLFCLSVKNTLFCTVCKADGL